MYLGTVNNVLGKWQDALEFLERCLTLSRQIRNQAIEGAALGNIGMANFLSGELTSYWVLRTSTSYL